MSGITRRNFIATTAAAGAAAGLAAPAIAQANYPSRPVTVIVPWGAGGGTDATARIIAQLLERDLGQPFNVVNRVGGSGVVGHSAIANAAPDGYTIGMATVEITMMHWQGLTELNPSSYTALALMNEDPPGITIRNPDTRFADVRSLAEYIKANPGRLKASGTGQGGIWHLALVRWLGALGLPPTAVPWVPSNGAAPAMQDLAAGGIDLSTCSLPEAAAMISAGRAKPLAIMAAERSPQYPDVPTVAESMGNNFTATGAWRGIVGPRNLPQPVVTRLSQALKKIYESQDYRNFMSPRGFGLRYADGPAFAEFMAAGDRAMGEAMRSAGLARG